MSSPEELQLNFRHQEIDYDIKLVKGGKSKHSVELNGVTYAILGDENKLDKAREILQSVSLESTLTEVDLKGKLSFPTTQHQDARADYIRQIEEEMDSVDKKMADMVIDLFFLEELLSRHQCSIYGNVPFHEAKIIGFADQHSNDNFAIVIGAIINRFFKDTNVVVAEGIAAHKVVSKEEVDSGRMQFVTRPVNVIGWDILVEIPSYKKYHEDSQILIDVVSKFNEADTLEKVMKALNQVKESFINDADVTNIMEKVSTILKEAFIKFESNDFNFKTLKYTMNKAIGMIFQVTDNAIYSVGTPEDLKKIRETLIERNGSLCNVLGSNISIHDKVFLIAGWAHLFTCSKNEWDNIDNVKNILVQNSHVIIVPNSAATEQIMSLNPEYKKLSLF